MRSGVYGKLLGAPFMEVHYGEGVANAFYNIGRSLYNLVIAAVRMVASPAYALWKNAEILVNGVTKSVHKEEVAKAKTEQKLESEKGVKALEEKFEKAHSDATTKEEKLKGLEAEIKVWQGKAQNSAPVSVSLQSGEEKARIATLTQQLTAINTAKENVERARQSLQTQLDEARKEAAKVGELTQQLEKANQALKEAKQVTEAAGQDASTNSEETAEDDKAILFRPTTIVSITGAEATAAQGEQKTA